MTSAAKVCLAGVAVTIALLSVVAGCRRSNQVPVRGAVTLDGAPLAIGLINFQPAEGTVSRSSGATIRNGTYEITAAQGLPPGKYLVTVQAYKETGRMIRDPQMGQRPEFAAVVFAEKLPLEATIAPGKENVCDFRLTSAKAGK